MSTGMFYFLALFYSDLLTPQKLQRITGVTTVQRQASFAFVISARVPKNTPRHRLHMPPNIIKRLFLLFYW